MRVVAKLVLPAALGTDRTPCHLRCVDMPLRRVRRVQIAALTAFALTAPHANATFSVLALERSSGSFGFASASCVHLDTLRSVYSLAPARGAVAAQSYLMDGDQGRIEAAAKLSSGWTATQTLTHLLSPSFDPEAQTRQYLLLDAAGNTAAHTGSETDPYAAHVTRAESEYVVVAAGNFLTGPEVLERALAGFYSADACDFAARLQQALMSAGTSPHGDARCIAEGRPAQSAWLSVGDLDLQVEAPDAPATDDPLVELSARFRSWRASHPCPPPPAPTTPTAPVTSSRSSSCATACTGSTNASFAPVWLLACAAWMYRRRRSSFSAAS